VWGGHSCPPLLTLGLLCVTAKFVAVASAADYRFNFEEQRPKATDTSVRRTQEYSSTWNVFSTSMFIRHRQDCRDSLLWSGGNQVKSDGQECPSHTPLDRMYEYRRKLPHYQKAGRALFVTFCKGNSTPFPPEVRDAVIRHCLHDHGKRFHLHAAVVTPDHVHLLAYAIARIRRAGLRSPFHMKGTQGVFSRSINKLLGSSGPVWQERVIRSRAAVAGQSRRKTGVHAAESCATRPSEQT